MKTVVRWGFTPEPKEKTQALVHQVHGTDWLEVPSSSAELKDADGVLTQERDREIHIFTADCLPVLFYGEAQDSPIMAVHAGWRGAKAGIVSKSLAEMKRRCARVTAILGPCLGVCCFQVKEDFIQSFVEARGNIGPYLKESQSRYYFDLVKFVIEQELQGLQGELNTDALVCTYCSKPTLPSFRRNKSTDPRLRAWIVRLTVDETRMGRT